MSFWSSESPSGLGSTKLSHAREHDRSMDGWTGRRLTAAAVDPRFPFKECATGNESKANEAAAVSTVRRELALVRGPLAAVTFCVSSKPPSRTERARKLREATRPE